MPCYAMLCNAMLRYALLCSALLCCAMLCSALLSCAVSPKGGACKIICQQAVPPRGAGRRRGVHVRLYVSRPYLHEARVAEARRACHVHKVVPVPAAAMHRTAMLCYCHAMLCSPGGAVLARRVRARAANKARQGGAGSALGACSARALRARRARGSRWAGPTPDAPQSQRDFSA